MLGVLQEFQMMVSIVRLGQDVLERDASVANIEDVRPLGSRIGSVSRPHSRNSMPC